MDAKTIQKFVVGSSNFFKELDDYVLTDVDELHIIDCPVFGEKTLIIHKDNRDIFLMYNSVKNDLINNIYDPLQVGKFLVPEFAKYIDLTIEDLKKLEQWFDKLDNKHSYEKLIYEYYIKNNDFFLSEEQLKKVYIKYKEYR